VSTQTWHLRASKAYCSRTCRDPVAALLKHATSCCIAASCLRCHIAAWHCLLLGAISSLQPAGLLNASTCTFLRMSRSMQVSG
jgi:hypothetical protein